MTINDQILEYVRKNSKASPVELVEALKVSESSISKYLKDLVANGQLIKNGKHKDTYYTLAIVQKEGQAIKFEPAPVKEEHKPQQVPIDEQAQIIKDVKDSFSNTAQEVLDRQINPQGSWNQYVFFKSVMKLLASVGLKFWVLLIFIFGYLIYNGVNYYWIMPKQKEIEAARAQNLQLQAMLAGQEQKQNQLQEQLSALKQGQKTEPAMVPAPKKDETPVDYNALIAHPLTNANNTVNFFKRFFAQTEAPKTSDAIAQKPLQGQAALPAKENQQAQGRDITLVKEIGKLQAQQAVLNKELGLMQKENQSKQEHISQLLAQNRVLLDAQQKMAEVMKDNERLKAQYINEQAINRELNRQLKLAYEQAGQGASASTSPSYHFDENGERIIK